MSVVHLTNGPMPGFRALDGPTFWLSNEPVWEESLVRELQQWSFDGKPIRLSVGRIDLSKPMYLHERWFDGKREMGRPIDIPRITICVQDEGGPPQKADA